MRLRTRRNFSAETYDSVRKNLLNSGCRKIRCFFYVQIGADARLQRRNCFTRPNSRRIKTGPFLFYTSNRTRRDAASAN